MHPFPPPIPYELRIGVAGEDALPDREQTEQAVERVLSHIRDTLQSATKEPRGRCGPRQTPWQQVLRWIGKGLKWFWRRMPITADLVPKAFQTPIEWTVISPLARSASACAIVPVSSVLPSFTTMISRRL